jgi:hypothetical protein
MHLFTTVQTLFSSIKPPFYYTSIFKLIYVYYSASQRFNDLEYIYISVKKRRNFHRHDYSEDNVGNKVYIRLDRGEKKSQTL